MSSDSDDLSSDSNSSSISSNSIEYHEWESRVVQYNQRTDRILEDVIINYPNLFIQDQTSRARRAYRDREREQGEALLMADYFVDNPTFDEVIFRRRFRMRKHLFVRIVDAVTANNAYFQQRRDATGRQSLSSLQKCTGAMRVLAYGISFDVVDEYLRMSGAVTRKSLMSFVQGVISCFGDEYLRRPNEDDLARLLNVGEQRGFPGMIGSIDCMHWQWKNCPKGWAGQYAGRNGKPTIILEAVASYDLWIWHAFFGTPGSCNDINVLHRSPVFNDVLEGRAPKVSYVVNGNQKNMAYYLTDGIYPSWAAFVKSISSPQIRKHRLFAQHQEAVRKDVERAFGVLQARFAFLRHPCLIWDYEQMGQIMIACIIMHNMIVEDERETYRNYDPSEFFNDTHTNGNDDVVEYSTERIADLRSYMRNREQLRNREAHSSLRNDLIEHIWQKFGDDN
ncbi:putative nuclease HARBI1 [Tanacetum coccineum]